MDVSEDVRRFGEQLCAERFARDLARGLNDVTQVVDAGHVASAETRSVPTVDRQIIFASALAVRVHLALSTARTNNWATSQAGENVRRTVKNLGVRKIFDTGTKIPAAYTESAGSGRLVIAILGSAEIREIEQTLT